MAVHRRRGRDASPGAGGPGVGGANGIPQDIADRMRGSTKKGYAGGGYDVRLTPGDAGYVPAQFRVALPIVEKPPGASDFNIAGTLAARNIANSPSTLATFQIPANSVAAIRAISILANALLVTSDIRWILRFNGVAVTGWNALTINPRAAGSVEVSWTPEETFIRVPEGSLVSWDVNVVDAGTYQLSVQFHGWFYSVALDGVAQQAYP